MSKSQKEYYLREQIRAIQEELGGGEDPGNEAEEWKKRLKKLKLDPVVNKKVEKEIDQFTKMAPSSPEAAVIRSYVENILDLPWNKADKTELDINNAQTILDEDHYGMTKVKDRILEYLAVQNLSRDNKAPILCLVGPPGVGKTSIARSVARATGRKFVHMSLGGVRDEAEIRGHRRTYIGAIPGRIMTLIKECGTKNPVFLFDEVDKIGADFRGDPASALLEVLDPEQNKEFVDHYLEVPFDLSGVLFITTANGTTILPVSKVAVGVATGGLDYVPKKENDPKGSNFGGGGGTGLSVTPVGFLIVKPDGEVELLNINNPTDGDAFTAISSLVSKAPDVFSKVKGFFGKKKKNKDAEEDLEEMIENANDRIDDIVEEISND